MLQHECELVSVQLRDGAVGCTNDNDLCQSGECNVNAGDLSRSKCKASDLPDIRLSTPALTSSWWKCRSLSVFHPDLCRRHWEACVSGLIPRYLCLVLVSENVRLQEEQQTPTQNTAL